MDERYMITVVGKQTVDGDTDTIEVITTGDMTIADGKVTIIYPEYAQDEPSKVTDTTVTLEGGVLSIDRQGEMSSHLILEQGVRHECLYRTDKISSDIDEHGGEINAAYQLDFNRSAVSYNEFYISVKEK